MKLCPYKMMGRSAIPRAMDYRGGVAPHGQLEGRPFGRLVTDEVACEGSRCAFWIDAGVQPLPEPELTADGGTTLAPATSEPEEPEDVPEPVPIGYCGAMASMDAFKSAFPDPA